MPAGLTETVPPLAPGAIPPALNSRPCVTAPTRAGARAASGLSVAPVSTSAIPSSGDPSAPSCRACSRTVGSPARSFSRRRPRSQCARPAGRDNPPKRFHDAFRIDWTGPECKASAAVSARLTVQQGPCAASPIHRANTLVHVVGRRFAQAARNCTGRASNREEAQ